MRLKFGLSYVAFAAALAACSGHDSDKDPAPDGGDPGTGGYTGAGGKSGGTGGKTGGSGGKTGGTGGVPGSGGAIPEDDGGAVKVLSAPSRGAAVVLSDDERISVVVNRDVGTVSVLSVKYEDGQVTTTESIGEVDVGPGSEPWQAVIAPDNETAYVVLKRDQKMVRIRYLSTKPVVDGYAYVGSEPTSIALSPTGRTAYVANWTDGTVSIVNTKTLESGQPVDLNEALVKTGYLGEVAARPALAHPRSLTVTNDGDTDDTDEKVLVTEYFAQQIQELDPTGNNADVARTGVVYAFDTYEYVPSAIALAPIADIGFKDANGNAAGCFPNQLQSITINGGYAYVVSVCASPEGPEGLKLTTKECQAVTECQGDDLKLVDPVCDVVAFGKPKVCQDVAGFKVATSPVVSVVDIAEGKEVPGSARNMNKAFDDFFGKSGIKDGAKRFPLFAKDLAFVPGTGVGYLVGNAIDAVFRVVYDAKTGELKDVGASTAPFIALNPAGIAADKGGKGPIGIASGAQNKKFALVANDITRNVTTLDFNTQAIAGGVKTPSVTRTAALPEKGSDEEHVLLGKDLFNTGRARWSLNGEGWGACQSCHSDGLTDNVTWFFGRGPRQSTSLDGTFASKNSLDQRILNHTATRDELADFDINTRATSGGVGAVVLAKSNPPVNVDRIDIQGLKLAELDGSSLAASDPTNPLKLGIDAAGKVLIGHLAVDPNAKSAGGQLDDWINITRYVQTLRTPRAPSNLNAELVKEGERLFEKYGACQGCHGGDKWTVSRLFYEPTVANTTALKVTSFQVPSGFPASLLPAQDPQDQKLVINAGGESVQCVMRSVNTFNVAESGVGIAEVRGTDMKTIAQGGGLALRPNADGDNDPTNDPKVALGYNVPSLLGMATAAPFLHAGNARTLEALLAGTFQKHHTALAPNFLAETDDDVVKDQVDALVAYLLSIDEDKAVIGLPSPGAQGGALCPETFTAPPPPAP